MRKFKLFFFKIIKRGKKNQHGFSETTVIIYSLLVFMIFAVLYVDLYGYFYTKNNLKQAVDETLTLVKFENGFDDRTRNYFENIAAKLGLDASKINLQGTPKTVQRGDPLELVASTYYEVRGLRPLNHPITVQIVVRSHGLAHSKIR
ncbi:MAG: DUF4320 family protein [Clostridia bacterium]|jgi:hypothetical protein|nr:DUF4320 family protein [Clostridia bacterium]